MLPQHASLARVHYASLHELARLIKARGLWSLEPTPDDEVARLAHDLFELVARADRRLRTQESRLFQSLVEADCAYGGRLQDAHLEPASGALFKVAREYDSVFGTDFVQMARNSLWALGHLIASADGELHEAEREALEGFLERLGANQLDLAKGRAGE